MHYQHRAKRKAVAKPSTLIINIAVDTAYLYVQSSRLDSGLGIYMMDNGVSGGSVGEGMRELDSMVRAGSEVAFNVFPINALGEQGDSVQIVGIELPDGTNIFGNSGLPKKQSIGSSYQWTGTVMMQGNCNYQLKIAVSTGGAPIKYFEWAPFIRCVD